MRFAIALLLMTVLAGCETPPDRSEVDHASPAALSTPLDLDPTEDVEIGHWWSNGRELLRLDPDGAFRLYDTLNRYHPSKERGRWSQPSYAVMWLEPYSLLPRERVRVRITKVNDELRLNIPKLDAFFAIEQPPAVTEDVLFGTWHGPMGVLRLDASMRYHFTPEPDLQSPIATAGHRGRWRVIGDQDVIRITPDTMGMGPFELHLAEERDRLRLTMPDGQFELDAHRE